MTGGALQNEEPMLEKEPAGHGRQFVKEAAPATKENVLSGQALQVELEVAPRTDE